MANLWQSFMDVMAPGCDCKPPKASGPQNPMTAGHPQPRESRVVQSQS